MLAGYSKTPLAKKLGIKEGFRILVVNKPKHYYSILEGLPEGVVEIERSPSDAADFIHIFCTTYEELKAAITTYKPVMNKDGMLWVSWPKGSSNIPTDLKRDPIREHLLSIGLVDVKVCAIDEDWSGLKFVYRVKDR